MRLADFMAQGGDHIQLTADLQAKFQLIEHRAGRPRVSVTRATAAKRMPVSSRMTCKIAGTALIRPIVAISAAAACSIPIALFYRCVISPRQY
jgi:hypothetical protein